MNMTKVQKVALQCLVGLLAIAFKCNDIAPLDGAACCAVFDSARRVARDGGLPERIVDIAIENGEYDAGSLLRFWKQLQQ